MKHLTEMKPGETLRLRSGREPRARERHPCHLRPVMLTFNVTERKEAAEK